MEVVQPIRNAEKLERLKAVLRERSERDWFLLEMGINVGLRKRNLLKLHDRDVSLDDADYTNLETGCKEMGKINLEPNGLKILSRPRRGGTSMKWLKADPKR